MNQVREVCLVVVCLVFCLVSRSEAKTEFSRRLGLLGWREGRLNVLAEGELPVNKLSYPRNLN